MERVPLGTAPVSVARRHDAILARERHPRTPPEGDRERGREELDRGRPVELERADDGERDGVVPDDRE